MSVVRRWQQQITTLSCFCIFCVAELSHRCDAKLVPRDCCCSIDVASPPCASWRMMKVPVLPSALTMDDLCVHVFVCMWTTSDWGGRPADDVGICVGNPRYPFIPNRWGSGMMGSYTLISDLDIKGCRWAGLLMKYDGTGWCKQTASIEEGRRCSSSFTHWCACRPGTKGPLMKILAEARGARGKGMVSNSRSNQITPYHTVQYNARAF